MWRWTGWTWGGGEVGWGRVKGTTPLHHQVLTWAKEGVAVRHLRNPPIRSSWVIGKGSSGG